MLPALRAELSAERTRELRLAADKERLAGAARPRRAAGSPRHRLGRRLISLGVLLLGGVGSSADGSLMERIQLR